MHIHTYRAGSKGQFTMVVHLVGGNIKMIKKLKLKIKIKTWINNSDINTYILV